MSPLEINLELLKKPHPRRGTPERIEWEKAFDWYNETHRKGGYPLRMACLPCYHKVLVALTIEIKKQKKIKFKPANKGAFKKVLESLMKIRKSPMIDILFNKGK